MNRSDVVYTFLSELVLFLLHVLLLHASPTVVTGSSGNSTCLAAIEILTGHQRAVVVIECRWRHDKETQRQ